jgi:hypothetical protein
MLLVFDRRGVELVRSEGILSRTIRDVVAALVTPFAVHQDIILYLGLKGRVVTSSMKQQA